MEAEAIDVNVAGLISSLVAGIASLPDQDKIAAINNAKVALHGISPMKSEPVDCVIWVKGEAVSANDYNPNAVAPPEMELLKVSILEDGYTQPIVTFKTENGTHEVIDGFHRNRVGKECDDVRSRIGGYLPVVVINDGRSDRGDRIAATIRHNRARGKHQVQAMAGIVVELKRRNWSDARIGKNLGMDDDEVLRLCQITGMAELFANTEFSKSWDIRKDTDDSDIKFEDGNVESD